MRREDIEEASRVIARLLAEVDDGRLEAPPKLIRLLGATQNALEGQLRSEDPLPSPEAEESE
jgi:hypothetical protein